MVPSSLPVPGGSDSPALQAALAKAQQQLEDRGATLVVSRRC
jgi:hypothetical protein